jgi:predicted ribosome quality control (RQC) complex YloA/Tae2 family protein
MSSKGKPYRRVVVDGFEILIGKGDRENDVLTFEIAEPRDLWMHVAGGVAGSHVLVRVPEEGADVPRAVVERAAALTGWYSKARNARRVDVHVCRVADVSKRRGAPAGEVHLRHWKVVRVAPSGE